MNKNGSNFFGNYIEFTFADLPEMRRRAYLKIFYFAVADLRSRRVHAGRAGVYFFSFFFSAAAHAV